MVQSHPRRRYLPPILLSFLLSTLFASTSLAQVRTLGLQEMTSSAGMIFVGVVTTVHSGVDQNGDIVTWTTFQVEQAIDGVAGTSVTVKQLGGEARGLETRLAHMRYFQTGERVLVMFYPVSSLGFTSPIGLSRGIWPVAKDGTIQGVSGAALQGLGAMLPKYGLAVRPSQSIKRSTFVGLVKELRKGREK